jgi:hypothetical protein
MDFRRSPSAPLIALSLLMLFAFAASVAGIFVDSRTITGVPAWLKPAKFAISIALYTSTLAWLLRYISIWPGFIRSMAWIVSITLLIEIVIIDVQAARGVTSHFNIATGLDQALFSTMGSAIVILWLASAGILAALFRQKFADPAWGWALRLGMLITIIGSASGAFMLQPTRTQLADARAQHRMPSAGGHTVGGPDGGPGFPGLGWSTEYGDLRVPHFFGLHGVQIIPAIAWLIGRRRTPPVFVAAASYFTFVLILAWQALRGESVFRPDSSVLSAFGIWAVVTLAAAIWVGRLQNPGVPSEA